MDETEENAEESAYQATPEEVRLLASLIYCEAGNQSHTGKVAVANVVLNRVESEAFPDTITDVIYEKGQFEPAGSGWLKRVLKKNTAPESCYVAALEALSGGRPAGDAVFFMRKELHRGGLIIGAHAFFGAA